MRGGEDGLRAARVYMMRRALLDTQHLEDYAAQAEAIVDKLEEYHWTLLAPPFQEPQGLRT